MWLDIKCRIDVEGLLPVIAIAIAYTVKVVMSRKRCKIMTLYRVDH